MHRLPWRSAITLVHDLFWAAASYPIALWLRTGQIEEYADFLTFAVPVFTIIAFFAFGLTGLYRGVWRYASMDDLSAIARGVGLSLFVSLPILFFFGHLGTMPRSLPIIQGIVLLFCLGGPRVAYRLWKDSRQQKRQQQNDNAIPVVLVGSDAQSDLFIRHCRHHPEVGYQVVGLITPSEHRKGRRIQGVEIIGSLSTLTQGLDRLVRRGIHPRRLILSSDLVGGDMIHTLMEIADRRGLTLARLPRMTNFDPADDGKSAMDLRPIAVEDLLGRHQVALDRQSIARLIHGRRVLVTGAGGSIGSEMVRQIAAFSPARLVLLDASEFALYTIDLEIAERFPQLERRSVITSVRDRQRLIALLQSEKPDLVFHAAALKHVPLVEGNPIEGILTNAIGGRNLADACTMAGVQAMVMISTDKAVNPTNVMGTTKRAAELYCQSLDLAQHQTRFVTVRFGNVLGSTGSVVPRFQSQLAAGGPLTVTHPEMERYFMTIREAVELVLQASARAVESNRHEAGKIYVLDMGKPVKIVDLARQMIRLAGLVPDVDIPIVFTGLRPGEKLFEEIFHGEEAPVPTDSDGILLASPRFVERDTVRDWLERLEAACNQGNTEAVITLLRELVPEFIPDSARH